MIRSLVAYSAMVHGSFSAHTSFATMVNNKEEYAFIKQTLTFYPNMKLEVSSIFYFKMLFTGNYDRGCGFTFNIMDNNTENIYHLDMRFNIKNSYRTLKQSEKLNGYWLGVEVSTDLPDLRKENDIFVSITDEYFKLTINNIEITPKLATKLTRLSSFNHLKFIAWGHCAKVSITNSYMSNEG